MSQPLTDLADRINPSHTAILVVDMQNDFCAEGGYIDKVRKADMSGNAALAERIMGLVDAGRSVGAMVVWIKANYERRYLSGQALAKLDEMGVDLVCCEGGSWGWDFYGVAPLADELVVEKHTYSAFYGTELDGVLRFNGIQTLVLAGVATNVCVESTLRDGYFNGYYTLMPQDCVGSYAPDLHEASLRNVKNLFGDIPPAKTVIDVWRDLPHQTERARDSAGVSGSDNAAA